MKPIPAKLYSVPIQMVIPLSARLDSGLPDNTQHKHNWKIKCSLTLTLAFKETLL